MIAHDRQSVGRIIATGGALAYGRKPWLALRIRSLLLAP